MPTLHLEEGVDLPDWRITAERIGGVFHVDHGPIVDPVAGAYKLLPSLKAQVYTRAQRPAEHDHQNDVGDTPVVILDLNGTLTPAPGFPLDPPYPLVKETLDMLVAGGCCLHIATAALGPQHSDEIVAVRTTAIMAWLAEWGLPVSFITGKVSSHVFYDDRMVCASPVPGSGTGGRPWDEIAADTVGFLDARFKKDKSGLWRRKSIPEAGKPIKDFPEAGAMLPDTPRAISSPAIDIDMHRCLTQASSSMNVAAPSPGAVDAVKLIYAMGYFVNLSCQGWDPSTHTPEDSLARLGGMQQWLRSNGIPYDQMVAKDHGDVFVDDKGIGMVDFTADLPLILTALGHPQPEDEITGQLYGSEAPLTPPFQRESYEPRERKDRQDGVNVTINIPEGMVQNHIDEGAVKVLVDPPHLNLSDGAITVNNQQGSSEMEFEHDKSTGRLKRIRRR